MWDSGGPKHGIFQNPNENVASVGDKLLLAKFWHNFYPHIYLKQFLGDIKPGAKGMQTFICTSVTLVH